MTAPVAQFSGSPLSGPAPLTVTFADESANTPTAWTWEFQDGVGSPSVIEGTATPEFTYTVPGTYYVELTAYNGDGADIEHKVGYITVTEAGEPDPEPGPVPESPFDRGAATPGTTAGAAAAYMVAAPEWAFSTNPTKAVGRAVTSAAQADIEGRRGIARFWTAVALILEPAAALIAPAINADGIAVLTDLAEKYGSPSGDVTYSVN